MNFSALVKLALAGGVLWFLARRVRAANPCAGAADFEVCGPGKKCLKGKCVEFVRCADDPECSGIQADTSRPFDEFDPMAWLRSLEQWFAPTSGPITSPSDPRLDE